MVVLPFRLALLAEAHAQSGHVKAGLAVIDEALAIVAQSGQDVAAPHLYRLKGILLLQADCGMRHAK